MSTISQWCRYCGVENRLGAKFCYLCGRLLVAPDQRQQVPQQRQQNVPSQKSESRTSWRSSRFLLIILVVFIVLIGVVLAVGYVRSRTDITTVWQASVTSFAQQDQQEIQTALKSSLFSSNPGRITGHEFTIIDAQRQGDWAIFSANQHVSHDAQPMPTEPLFFLAHQQGTTWTVWLPSSPDFCDQLKQVPDTLLDATDKGYFC